MVTQIEVNKRVDDYLDTLTPADYDRLINALISNRKECVELEQFAEDVQDEPKEEIAKDAFYLKHKYPKVSMSKICAAMQISEGYYRQLRLVHKEEWELEARSSDMDAVIDAFRTANYDPTGKAWKEWYDYKDTPIELFLLS